MRRTTRSRRSLAVALALAARPRPAAATATSSRSTPAASSTSSGRSSSTSPRRPASTSTSATAPPPTSRCSSTRRATGRRPTCSSPRAPARSAYLDGLGRLAPLPDDVLDAVPDDDRAADGDWVGLTGRVRTLVYNTELVDEADLPGSVLDLTDPRVRRAARRRARQRLVPGLRHRAARRARRRRAPASGSRAWPPTTPTTYPEQHRHPRRRQPRRDRHGPDQPLLLVRGTPSTTPTSRAALHFFDDGDLGSMLLVTAASVLDTTRRARGRRASSSSSCSARRRRRYFAEETLEYPLAAGVEPVEGLFPLDEIVSARVDFDDARRPRRARIELIDESGLLERLTRSRSTGWPPVAGAPAARRRVARPRRPSVGAGLVVVGRRRRRLRRLRSPTSSSGPLGGRRRRRHPRATAARSVPLRSTLTLAVAVSAPTRGRRHRPGLAHDPHRPPAAGACWARRRRRCRSCSRASSAPPPCSPRSRRAGCSTSVVPGSTPTPCPTIEGFGGAWFVLTLFTYPYVYLPVAARLGVAAAVARGVGPAARPAPLAGVPHASCCPQTAGAIWAGRAARLPLRRVRLRRRRPAALPDADASRSSSRSVFDQRPAARARRCCSASSPSPSSSPSGPSTGAGRRVEVAPVEAPAAACRSAGGGGRRSPRVAVPARQRPARAAVGARLLGGRGASPAAGRLGGADLADLAEPATDHRRRCRSAPPSLAVAVVLPVAYLTARHRSRVGGVVNAAVVGGFALPGLLVALVARVLDAVGPGVDRPASTRRSRC